MKTIGISIGPNDIIENILFTDKISLFKFENLINKSQHIHILESLVRFLEDN